MIEQTRTCRGGFPAIILAKKDKISGISNPKLTLPRAGNTLKFGLSGGHPAAPLLMDHRV